MRSEYRIAHPDGIVPMIFGMRKMTINAADYFRYLPLLPEQLQWGVAVTAAGFAHISPGMEYPPVRHPSDHQFDWSRGRTLEAMQVVFIVAGGGWLETGVTGRRRVKAGMAFLLLPGIWHRYRPDQATGWVESWVELQGPIVDNLRRSHVFQASAPLRKGALGAGLGDSLEAVHRRVRPGISGVDPDLSAAALQVLAVCARSGESSLRLAAISRKVGEAERYLNDHFAEPVNVEELARKLGVAYSYFRKTFLSRTGFSPWQYVLHLRLSRARRLLAASDAKLDDVAAAVGFGSGFQLSHAFKRAYGQSPATWRKGFVGK
jgi:AraC-like DNA-binding protein